MAERSCVTWQIYDGTSSELYVDGVKEAAGKSVGRASLDGLRLGCDHTSTFYLKGAIAEVRLFSCHLSERPRAQIEAALAIRYGLNTGPAAAHPSQMRLRRASSS